MSYKMIDSVLHNLGHSFCSDMNMISEDGKFQGFMFKEINNLFSKYDDLSKFSLNISTMQVEPIALRSSIFLNSMKTYSTFLSTIAENQNLDIRKLAEVQLHFSRADKKNYKAFKCHVTCLDDRGIKHSVEVPQTK